MLFCLDNRGHAASAGGTGASWGDRACEGGGGSCPGCAGDEGGGGGWGLWGWGGGGGGEGGGERAGGDGGLVCMVFVAACGVAGGRESYWGIGGEEDCAAEVVDWAGGGVDGGGDCVV